MYQNGPFDNIAQAAVAGAPIGFPGGGGIAGAFGLDKQQAIPKLSEVTRTLNNVTNAHDTLEKTIAQLAERLGPVTAAPAAIKQTGNAAEPAFGSQLANSIQASASRANAFNQRLRDLLDSLAI